MQLPVGANGGATLIATAGESRRIRDDEVEPCLLLTRLPQIVERIRHDKFMRVGVEPVELEIPASRPDRDGGRIDAGYSRGARSSCTK